MKSNFKKYFSDGLLIVFSVLFALFINKTFDKIQTNKKKRVAQESIIKELYRNQAILKNWKQSHIKMRDRITNIIGGKEDSLKMKLAASDYLDLGLLTNNESLIDAFLTNTAWESAQTSGIISEFDYETIQKLTYVYDMQNTLTEHTIMKILDYYFDTESHNMKNVDQILIQFQLRFWELTGQEELMTTLYNDAIEQIE